MIAYNSHKLDNLLVTEAAEQALKKQCITAGEYENIKTAHPSGFYTPNPYMRIGLFILTVIIVLFSFGLFIVIALTGNSNADAFGGLTVFFGLATYGMLEYMVHEKKHYKSGVDASLMWMSGIFIISSIYIFTEMNVTPVQIFSIVFVTGTLLVLRFADVLMSAVAYLAFLGMLFYICLYTVHVSLLFMPFLLMGVSLGIYLLAVKLSVNKACRHYTGCLAMIEIIALLTLYLAGNYFIVREARAVLFYEDLPGDNIPAGWFFWILTVLIPAVYLSVGILKKNRILIRTGLVLVAAIVFTIRYYHSVAPLEVAMTLGGMIMIIFAYGIIKYLHVPKNKFTYEETDDQDSMASLQIESVVIAQTFNQQAQPDNRFDFGGGSGSGGGASGQY